MVFSTNNCFAILLQHYTFIKMERKNQKITNYTKPNFSLIKQPLFTWNSVLDNATNYLELGASSKRDTIYKYIHTFHIKRNSVSICTMSIFHIEKISSGIGWTNISHNKSSNVAILSFGMFHHLFSQISIMQILKLNYKHFELLLIF